MNENLISGQYDVKKKSKIKKFYDDNKIYIYSILFAILIIIFTLSLYSYLQNKKKISIAQNYINATIFVKNGNKSEALSVLKKIIYANDSTYSTLSLFLIVNENLEKNNLEAIELFNHVIENSKFDDESRNLLVLKKAFYETNLNDEQKILNTIKPLLSKDSVWKANALMLVGNYFVSKGEDIKAKEFFLQILNINNLSNEIIDQANNQLKLIQND